MRVKILGKYWDIRFRPNLGGNDGDCDYESKVLRLRSSLRGDELMETCIHEVLHGANGHLTEEFVTDFARDVTRILRRKSIWERITPESD
jgi:hypothetical protein